MPLLNRLLQRLNEAFRIKRQNATWPTARHRKRPPLLLLLPPLPSEGSIDILSGRNFQSNLIVSNICPDPWKLMFCFSFMCDVGLYAPSVRPLEEKSKHLRPTHPRFYFTFPSAACPGQQASHVLSGLLPGSRRSTRVIPSDPGQKSSLKSSIGNLDIENYKEVG